MRTERPDLGHYLERIGYDGPVAPTPECLTGVHRRQALAVPYENLDIQLGLTVSHDIDHIFDKVVRRRRGGWCYELNGLLFWGLTAIGFEVSRATAGIFRREYGDAVLGNHMMLLIHLEGRSWIADLGLGDGIREPLPLEAGPHQQGELSYRLERVDGGYWRYWNHPLAYPGEFDFRDAPADEAVIAAKREFLRTSPESTFVKNVICQQMEPEAITCLTGRVLRHKSAEGTQKRLINSAGELEAVVAETFGIRNVDVAGLWPRVAARHEALFGDRDADQIEIAGM